MGRLFGSQGAPILAGSRVIALEPATAAGRRRTHGGESRPTLTSRIVRNSVVLVVLAVFGLAVLWTFMGDGEHGRDLHLQPAPR